jgi:hypothetical protein
MSAWTVTLGGQLSPGLTGPPGCVRNPPPRQTAMLFIVRKIVDQLDKIAEILQ